jgi:hypothetical protein
MDNGMDNTVLKKKLSTFRSPKGSLIGVPPEVLYEVLRAWESWKGTSKEFYSSIGVSQKQMAGVLGKAKKLQREGAFPAEEFKEIAVGVPESAVLSAGGIEVMWETGKVIRFPTVDSLLDFLKRVA